MVESGRRVMSCRTVLLVWQPLRICAKKERNSQNRSQQKNEMTRQTDGRTDTFLYYMYFEYKSRQMQPSDVGLMFLRTYFPVPMNRVAYPRTLATCESCCCTGQTHKSRKLFRGYPRNLDPLISYVHIPYTRAYIHTHV